MNNQMWYYPFRHTFVSSTEEDVIENREIINECNVSIEREHKIILVKKVSFLLRAMMFKAEFQKLLFFNDIVFFSMFLWYSVISYLMWFIISFSLCQTLCCVEQRKRKEHHFLEVRILKRNEWLRVFNHFSW